MRSTLDKIFSAMSLLLALALAIASALLFWAGSFVDHEVKSQFGQQNITMPGEKTGLNGVPEADRAELAKYADTPLDSGDKAKAYADHFIMAHMNKASGGKSYSQISNEQRQLCPEGQPASAASPECQKATGLKNTLFQGNTLRGLLLYGYAFATMGRIATIGAWVSGIGALLSLLLGLLGLNHAKKALAQETAAGRSTATVRTDGVATDGAHRA